MKMTMMTASYPAGYLLMWLTITATIDRGIGEFDVRYTYRVGPKK